MPQVIAVLVAFIFMSLPALSNPRAEATACFEYESSIVTLTGEITRHMEYGAPNYGESPATDEKEWYWYLDTDKPVCVNEDANAYGEHGIRRLQILYREYPSGDREKWVGHRVSITGTLSHSFTGHHHTKVLINPAKTTLVQSAKTFPPQ